MVNNRTAQKLTEVINGLSPMAATETGRQWLIKALHPSDELVSADGVPDLTASPSVLLNYQAVCTINPPQQVVQNNSAWTFDMAVIPDPIQPLAARATDMFNLNGVLFSFINPQLSTQTYSGAVSAFFQSGVLRWRLAYMSVSVYQDGPALADQGTLVAAQVPVEYQLVSYPGLRIPGSGVGSTFHVRVMNPAFNNLNYSSVQAQPNAYFGQSKFGTYMPLHLDCLSEDGWRGAHDMQLWQSSPATFSFQGIPCGYICPVGGQQAAYPYPTAEVAYLYSDTEPNPLGSVVCRPANTKWGVISGTNISAQSRITVYVRHGWEVMVSPTSQLASLQKVSPRFDAQALDNYGRIVRELKDAYPVDYNDLGKLWEVLKGAAKIALPHLSRLPTVGPIFAGLSSLVNIASAKPQAFRPKSEARQNTAPAAAVQEVGQALKGQEAAARAQQSVKGDSKRAQRRRAAAERAAQRKSR